VEEEVCEEYMSVCGGVGVCVCGYGYVCENGCVGWVGVLVCGVEYKCVGMSVGVWVWVV